LRGRRLPALLKRFESTTLELWHYLLAWESLAERETKWNKFATDPEWLSKRSESERDGPIVASITNMFLQPTAFSAVK
jgi:hypothetical protein